jgi:hypothetical protein
MQLQIQNGGLSSAKNKAGIFFVLKLEANKAALAREI